MNHLGRRRATSRIFRPLESTRRPRWPLDGALGEAGVVATSRSPGTVRRTKGKRHTSACACYPPLCHPRCEGGCSEEGKRGMEGEKRTGDEEEHDDDSVLMMKATSTRCVRGSCARSTCHTPAAAGTDTTDLFLFFFLMVNFLIYSGGLRGVAGRLPRAPIGVLWSCCRH